MQSLGHRNLLPKYALIRYSKAVPLVLKMHEVQVPGQQEKVEDYSHAPTGKRSNKQMAAPTHSRRPSVTRGTLSLRHNWCLSARLVKLSAEEGGGVKVQAGVLTCGRWP